MRGYNKKICECRAVKLPQCPVPVPSSNTRNYVRSCSPERTIPSVCPTRPEYTRCYSAPICKRNESKDWYACRNTRTREISTSYAPSSTKICKPKEKRNDESKSPERTVKNKRAIRPLQEKPNETNDANKVSGKPTMNEKEKKPLQGTNNHEKVEKVATLEEPAGQIGDTNETKENEETEKSSGVEDHEYVHFLLKITEDILRNNIYKDSDMEKLFESHVAANLGRLNEERMWAQIEHLKNELNFPLSAREPQCRCDDEELDEKPLDCLCCPAYQAPPGQMKGTCACDNPSCPGHETSDKISVTDKDNVAVLPKIDEQPSETKTLETIKSKQSNESKQPAQKSSEVSKPESVCSADVCLPGTCPTKSTRKPPTESTESTKSAGSVDKTIETIKSKESAEKSSEVAKPEAIGSVDKTIETIKSKQSKESKESAQKSSEFAKPESIRSGDNTIEIMKSKPSKESKESTQKSSEVAKSESICSADICPPGTCPTKSTRKSPTEGEAEPAQVNKRINDSQLMSKDNANLDDKKPKITSASQYVTEKVVGLSSIDEVKSLSDIEEDPKPDCIDPSHCRDALNSTEPQELTSDHRSKSKASAYSTQGITSLHSMVKIVNIDDPENTEPQIIFYKADESEQHCYCTVSLQKTALKIQLETTDKNEEYILVDGPVCMPRSMLEKKTMPVLIENVPSLVLDTEQNPSNDDISLSRVNLFQRSHADASSENYNMDSISGHINKGANLKGSQYYDLTPEREIQGEVVAAPTKGLEPILKKAPLKNDDENKTSDGETAKSPKSSIGKTASFGSFGISDVDQAEDEPEKQSTDSARKAESSVKNPQDERNPVVDNVKECGSDICVPKRCPNRLKKKLVQDERNPVVDDVKECGSDICVPKRCPNRLKKKLVQDSERQISDGKLTPGTGGNGKNGEKAETKVSGSVHGDNTSKSSDGKLTKQSSTDRQGSEHSSDSKRKRGSDRKKIIGDSEALSNVDEELPSTEHPSDFINKYHYLLMDVATNTSTSKLHEGKTVPVSSTKEDLGQEYMLLVDEEYEAEKLPVPEVPETESVPSPPRQPSLSHEQSDFESTVSADAISEEEEETKPPPDVNLFQYSNIPPALLETQTRRPNELTYMPTKGSDSLTEHASDITSIRPSIGTEREVSTVQPLESNVIIPPVVPLQGVGKPHEVLKVRYSMTRDFFDPENQALIAKLDEIPGTEPTEKEKDENVSTITEKMREFRRLDGDDDNANRRFQISNPDNFEIRMVSANDDDTDEDVQNNKKPQPTCCGLGPPSKTKRTRDGSTTSNESRQPRAANI